MERSSRDGAKREEAIEFGQDTIEQVMRERVRETIEMIVEEELEAALGAGRSVRVGRQRRGYRHGKRPRQLTTSLGRTRIEMPRARIQAAGGRTREWRSQVIGRYQRRTRRVDEAILGVYLSGANTRRVKGALAPLLREAPLSKDAVSRLVARLKEQFQSWRGRDLADDDIRYLYMDGWYPKLRLGRQRVVVPVLVTLAVRGDGERIVVDLRLAGQETAASWRDVVTALVRRRIGRPELAVIDGNPGLCRALREQWPKIDVQRCTAHKLRNLKAKAPAAMREELTEDYRRMIYADDREAVMRERAKFTRKWRLRCPAVVASLEEAGEELFTFLRYPRSQWRALRTTNALERINEEFRRRTKTQASLPSEDAVLLLLFGLLCSGRIKLHKLGGYQDMQPRESSRADAAA
ncbi:MAG: IS256 family transposase [Acidobacteriota bacterium]